MFNGRFNKNLLRGILASLAINTAGGMAVEKTYQEAKQTELTKDRERVKDVIFLPATKEELVQNLLEQAGVKDIAEIQKNPELAHKIDLGNFFIQVEFLEKKIDAKQAKKAILNLQLQRQVFTDLYDKTKNPLVVMNEVQNNIVDPQIFLDENDKAEAKQKNGGMDYKKGEALLSSYLLNGQSNCYSSVRAEVAIFSKVLPKQKLKVNELAEHVRLVVTDQKTNYLVDPGTPIRKTTPDDLAGTILYEDAHLAFLSGILELPNPNQYIASGEEADNLMQNSLGGLKNAPSKVSDLLDYKNTSIGNFFEITPTQLARVLSLKKVSSGDVPALADRQRMNLLSESEMKSSQTVAGKTYPEKNTYDQEDNNQEDSNQQKILDKAEVEQEIRKATVTQRRNIIKSEMDRVEIKERKEKIKKDSSNTKPEQIADHHTTTSEVPTTPTAPTEKQKVTFALIEAEPMIAAFIKDSVEHPEKEHANTKEILLWLKQMDDAGALETYAVQHAQEIARLEQLRPKPGEKSNSYLQAKFLVDDYLKKYNELKNKIDEKELLKNNTASLLDYLSLFGGLSIEYKNSLQKNPLEPEMYQIKQKDMDGFLKEVGKKLKIMKKHHADLQFIRFSAENDTKSAKSLLEFAKENPPHKIEITGAFQNLQELQDFLDSPKGKNTTVVWSNPPTGTDIKPIWKAITDGNLRLVDTQEINTQAALQDPKKQFSMVDKETKTIVNVTTEELRDKFGKDFIMEYFLRNALTNNSGTTDSHIKLEIKNYDFFPKSALNTIGIQDFENLTNLIKKFATQKQVEGLVSFIEFTGNNKDGFDFVNQLDLKKIAKFIPKKSDIKIQTHITDFPTENIGCKNINLTQASFGSIPPDFLTNNEDINFGRVTDWKDNSEMPEDIAKIDRNLKNLSSEQRARLKNTGMEMRYIIESAALDTFLEKISDAEMKDILIYDENVDNTEANGDSTILHTIYISTNTHGNEIYKGNYKFTIDCLTNQKNPNNHILLIEKILDKIKTKKIFLGEGTDQIKTTIQNMAALIDPTITVDDSDYKKRGIVK